MQWWTAPWVFPEWERLEQKKRKRRKKEWKSWQTNQQKTNRISNVIMLFALEVFVLCVTIFARHLFTDRHCHLWCHKFNKPVFFLKTSNYQPHIDLHSHQTSCKLFCATVFSTSASFTSHPCFHTCNRWKKKEKKAQEHWRTPQSSYRQLRQKQPITDQGWAKPSTKLAQKKGKYQTHK